MSLACRAVGLPGTAAILAGYYLHLDPYGHLHWSSADALVGLAGAVPVALAGGYAMLKGVQVLNARHPRSRRDRVDVDIDDLVQVPVHDPDNFMKLLEVLAVCRSYLIHYWPVAGSWLKSVE